MIRLLLVEDSVVDQELVRRAFRDPALFPDAVEITAVESVDEALALVERAAFDVILTDYLLPKRTGLDLLRALEGLGNQAPIIMLTGSADTAIAVTALQDGATDFVIKDIAYERALGVVVRRALDKRAIVSVHEQQQRESVPDRVQRLERQLDVQARELRRAMQESEALRRIAQLLSSTPALADALALVSRTAAQLLRAQAAAILLRHGNEHVIVNTWGALRQPAGVKHTDPAVLLAGEWSTVGCADLRDDDGTIGYLWVGRSCHGPFAAHEIELVEGLADLTALSIAKLRAREQIRRMREAPAPAPASIDAPQRVETAAGIALPQPVESSSPSPAYADDADSSPAFDQPTVLIMDDSEKVLLQARQALQNTMTVLTATSGKLGIEKYGATRPAVVVVDLVMPDMDGVATLAELRKLGCTTCLALVVRGDAIAQERARRAGYLGVVEKPFRAGELAAQIAGVLATADRLRLDGFFSEEHGHPVLTLPNPSLRDLAKILPIFDRHLRTVAEEGTDHLIVDASMLTQIGPDHVTMLVRLFSEAATLGIEPVICAADDRLIAKLRQIVELRDARYVPNRAAAKLALQ